MDSWAEDSILLRETSLNFRITDTNRLVFMFHKTSIELEKIILSNQIPQEEIFNVLIAIYDELEKRGELRGIEEDRNTYGFTERYH